MIALTILQLLNLWPPFGGTEPTPARTYRVVGEAYAHNLTVGEVIPEAS